MRNFRLLPLMALLCVSASANAFYIDLSSHGFYTIGSGTASSAETVIFQDSGVPLPALTNLNFTFSTSSPFTGTGTYTNGVDSLNFSFTYTNDVLTDLGSSTQSVHGFWTATGGTGALTGATGTGVIGTNFNAPAGQKSLTIFSGGVEALPEPASLAAIGIGVVGLVRRRRK